jgi:hypothetical protein
MTILSTVRQAFDQGWDALGDLRQTVTVKRISRGVYNPATGLTTDNVITADVLCVLTGYEASLIDGTDIKVGDMRCVLRGKDIDFRPEQGDSVTLPSGQIWRVMRATGDFYEPPLYHELTLRR